MIMYVDKDDDVDDDNGIITNVVSRLHLLSGGGMPLVFHILMYQFNVY